MKYIFGPVNSRRLGLSLGVDLLPDNICNFDCIYCEIGRTVHHTCERREYTPTAEIIAEIDLFLQTHADHNFDVCTITASGEPTLHTGIGKVIHHLKKVCGAPVVVLTNGALLGQPEVRKDLAEADIVMPSLDAARPASFKKINRPAMCCPTPQDIIQGIRDFAAEFNGKIWLEILLAAGANDTDEDILALKDAVKQINPDKVQLNTVARPPAESFATPISREKMQKIARQFDTDIEIVVDFSKKTSDSFQPFNAEEVINMLLRRPCTKTDICQALNLDPATIGTHLEQLEKSNRITRIKHHDQNYFHII